MKKEKFIGFLVLVVTIACSGINSLGQPNVMPHDSKMEARRDGGEAQDYTVQIGPGGPSKAAAGRLGSELWVEWIEKNVQVTPGQKTRIMEIVEAHRKFREQLGAEYWQKVAAASKALTAAETAKNADAIAKARKALSDLYAPLNEAASKMQKDLDSVLTPAQSEKLREAELVREIKALTEPVHLSDEQMKRAMASCRELPKGTGKGRCAKVERAVWNVLSVEQKTQLIKSQVVTYVDYVFGGVTLTAEQTKRVRTMVAEVANESRLATDWPDMITVDGKVHEKISAILTAQQKKAVRPIVLSGKTQ